MPGSDPTDLFAFKISYNEVTNDLEGKIEPLFNGNISETFWRTAMDNIKRNYGYQYDALNRLTGSIYQKNGFETNSYNEFPTYDKNGNILTMVRNGYQDGSDQVMPFEIDKLVYGYEAKSNRLLSVYDESQSINGFKDGNINDNDLKYDDYGNMIVDKNKEIEMIKYNHLNLPTVIDFGNSGIISYIYNALGVKVAKNVSAPEIQDQTEFENKWFTTFVSIPIVLFTIIRYSKYMSIIEIEDALYSKEQYHIKRLNFISSMYILFSIFGTILKAIILGELNNPPPFWEKWFN